MKPIKEDEEFKEDNDFTYMKNDNNHKIDNIIYNQYDTYEHNTYQNNEKLLLEMIMDLLEINTALKVQITELHKDLLNLKMFIVIINSFLFVGWLLST